MTEQLSNAYLAALAMMQVTGPNDLHNAATFVASDAGVQIDDAALIAYLAKARPNDPLQMDLSLKLTKWDHQGTDMAWTLGTAPNTTDRRQRIISLLGLGAEAAELLLALFPIAAIERPVVIATDWEPWYSESVKAHRSFYWTHYSGYLADEQGWEPGAIAALDVATDEIIERLSNPERTEAYQAKGLVVGHVQSGKTANFTGVIGKSIDVGYRLILRRPSQLAQSTNTQRIMPFGQPHACLIAHQITVIIVRHRQPERPKQKNLPRSRFQQIRPTGTTSVMRIAASSTTTQPTGRRAHRRAAKQ